LEEADKCKSLSFATITKLSEDIAEVIIHQGIEINLVMVEQYHAYLLEHLTAPFSLLINKTNSYSYTFEAQLALATLKEINVMAVVAYSHAAKVSTQDLVQRPRTKPWNLEVFDNREEALAWLKLNQELIQVK